MSYLTENLYYQIEKYNSKAVTEQALQSDNLLAPIVTDSQNWSVAIAKANVPISAIPLTADNIGLRKYAVTLGDGNRQNTTYVSQVGGTKTNFMWDSEGTEIYKRSYSANGTLTTIDNIDYSAIVPIVSISKFIIDDFQNAYITGPQTMGSSASTLYIIGSNQTVLETLEFANIVDLYIDRAQRLFVADAGEAQVVYVYTTDAAINSVNIAQVATLTEDFAGNSFTGLSMVCSGDSVVIVGHDDNKLTFFNSSTFTATHDFTETSVPYITDGCIIDSAATYGILGQNTSFDGVLGSVNSGGVYNLISDTNIVGGGDQVHGKYVVAPLHYTTTISGFVQGTDDNTYTNATFNPAASQTLTSYINPAAASTLACNKGSVVSLSLSDTLGFLNILPPGNTTAFPRYSTLLTKFYFTAPGDVIDIEYNEASQKMFAITSDFTVRYSLSPICPFNLFIADGTTSIRQRGISVANSVQNLGIQSIRTNTAPSQVLYTKYNITDERLYRVVGEPGMQTIQASNPITGATIQTYACTELAGTIPCFDFVGSTYLVTTADDFYHIYNISDGSLHVSLASSFNAANDVPAQICQMTAAGTAFFVAGAWSTAVLQQAAGVFTEVCFDQTVVSGGSGVGQILSITANELDTQNGQPTVFASVENYTLGQKTISHFGFATAYSSISLIAAIDSGVDAIFNTLLNCDYKTGTLWATNFSSGNTKIYWQIDSYSNVNTSSFTIGGLTQGITMLHLPQTVSITDMFAWDIFTVNGGTIKSIALSKVNPTVAYVVDEPSRLVYKARVDYTNGIISYSTASTPLSASQVDYVSAYIPSTNPATSVLTSFDITSQSQLGTVTFTAGVPVVAVAKNEIDRTYGVIDNGTFKTYNENMVLKASGTVAGLQDATCLDIRNGEDIDAGPVSIYDMAVLIAKINTAFQECYARLVLEGTTLTSAPSLSLNFQTGFLTLTYDASYLAADAFIEFNQALLAVCYFTNTAGVLSLGPGTSITQTSKSVFNFNDLQSVQFRSSNIFVNGQFYSTSLSSSRIICEIDPDTTTYVNNIGERLYYNPTILRSFFLNSSLPLQTISIQLYYTTKKGAEYPVLLNPGDFFSTKLNFIRKF
jgi:hypothetical protein